MNLKHLYYFWQVAKHGGVIRASHEIPISPQTLSGQIKLLEDDLGVALFRRHGRLLELTEAGQLALRYADDIFALSAELERVMRHHPKGQPTEFRVGVSDVVPKSLAYRLLRPAISLPQGVRIICHEWRLDRLLADLAIHRLDLVISDAPVPTNLDVRAYSHRLGESGVAWLADRTLAQRTTSVFPDCLKHLPLLLPGQDSAIRQKVGEWFRKYRLQVNVAGEFDDTALMAAFGQAQIGAFPVPSVLLDEYLQLGELQLLGLADDIRVDYFALSVQRHLTHPCVLAMTAKVAEVLER